MTTETVIPTAPDTPAPHVWRAVAIAAVATLLVAGLVIGGFTLYHSKTSEIASLTDQRRALQAETLSLNVQLKSTQATLATTTTKLHKSAKNYATVKANLTKLHNDLVAANKRAVDNYNAGYSAGQNAGYSAGNSAGYNTGREVGIVQASDELACSDDHDVYWLPACN
jgi:septal ring factor EnvC (AmiA/AmiB activator)